MEKVVGYIRVSTRRQAEEGISLEEQAHLLRRYCMEKDLELLSIEEDDCSAAGSQGHLYRPGLRKALSTAREHQTAILVPSVDRLARHPDILEEILKERLPVLSVAQGRRLGRRSLEDLLDRAKRERDLISSRVRAGAQRAKANGAKLGNRTNLGAAQRKGAITNGLRSDRKIKELADFIERTSGWEKMTLSERVKLLNSSGPHNLISEKRNERRPWTKGSLRKPLKGAESELQMRKDLESEAYDTWGQAQSSTLGDAAGDKLRSSGETQPSSNDGSVALAYKDNPDFGKF